MLPALVQRVVTRYLDAVDAACPGLVEGLYLVGSVALDDFQPGVSDVDFIAMTASPVDDATAEALAAAHADVRVNDSLPAFEGIYVTLDDLRASPSDAAPGLFHHDAELRTGREGRSPVEWTTLARDGVVLRGPAPAAIGVLADPDELATWTLDNLETYWKPWAERARDDATMTGVVASTDWGVAWCVLGVSRQHYTLATGDITSKSGGGRHALAVFDDRWRPIITEALRCRPHPFAAADGAGQAGAAARRDEAVAFLEMAIDAAQRLATSGP